MGLSAVEDDLGRIADALEQIAQRMPRPWEPVSHETMPTAAFVGTAISSITQVVDIKYDTVRVALLSFVDKYGSEAAAKLMAQFGTKSIKGIKPEQYADVLAAVERGP